MAISNFGYVRVFATDMDAWREYGTKVLGFVVGTGDDPDALYFRMDDHPHRWIIVPGEEDKLGQVGWECANEGEFEDVKSRLDAAGAQLAAGRNQLAAAREQLQEDLAALDKYSDEKERLEAGMKLLMSDENVKKLSGSTATYAELCDAAEEYFASQIDSANDEAWWANVLTAALTVTVILALISLLLWQFARSSGAAAIIAGISAVAALVCGVLWHSHCPADGTLAFAAGLTLCLIAVVCTDLMAHRAKEASAVPASSATAN